jgi:glycine dehydrogenase subunit 1
MALSKCSLEMLQEMGLKSVDDLFADVPKEVRTGGLRLPDGMSELDVRREIEAMMSVNRTASQRPSFLGAGIYHHFIPAAVRTITMRSEFITAYTPYQPEISQGMLQSLFEYQSFMAELTGMDVVNSSMYDASTALGEAALMSARISPGDRFLVSRAVSPERKAVAELYTKGADIRIEEVAFDPATGTVDLADLKAKLTEGACGFYFETPNFFGVLEPHWKEIRELLGKRPLVIGTNPMALALIKPPGEMGADIAIGEAQVFGAPMSFGGPLLGLFGCRTEHVRKMPGRIIGMTNDLDGRRAFCMTLATREQHIRRSKATSNICSNEALMAVGAAAYLAVMGRSGLREIAARNVRNARELAARLSRVKGFTAPRFKGAHFNEFVVTSDRPSDEVHRHLLSKDIQGGLPLGGMFPELGHSTLYCTTEMHTAKDHDALISALEGSR